MLIPLLLLCGGLRLREVFLGHSIAAWAGILERCVGGVASQASGGGEAVFLKSKGAEGVEACNCERIEEGEVLICVKIQYDCLLFSRQARLTPISGAIASHIKTYNS